MRVFRNGLPGMPPIPCVCMKRLVAQKVAQLKPDQPFWCIQSCHGNRHATQKMKIRAFLDVKRLPEAPVAKASRLSKRTSWELAENWPGN